MRNRGKTDEGNTEHVLSAQRAGSKNSVHDPEGPKFMCASLKLIMVRLEPKWAQKKKKTMFSLYLSWNLLFYVVRMKPWTNVFPGKKKKRARKKKKGSRNAGIIYSDLLHIRQGQMFTTHSVIAGFFDFGSVMCVCVFMRVQTAKVRWTGLSLLTLTGREL